MLWQHNPDSPIGTLTLLDTPTALKVKGQLLMDLPDAKKAYILIKAKVIKGLSIGYDTIKDSVENGVRLLKEVRLWEGSIVTFPMNEMAMITSVKRAGAGAAPGETKDDFNTELVQIQLQDVGYQMRYALFQALGSVTWASGLTKEDKITAAQTTIDQFAVAFMEYFPQYLDYLAAEYGDMSLMNKLHHEEKAFATLLRKGLKATRPVVVTIDNHGLLTPEDIKEGRKFSAATKKSLDAAHEHVKGLSDIFGALLDGEADDEPETDDDDVDDLDDDGGDDTGNKGGGTPASQAAKKGKSEPEPSHSAETAAEEELLKSMRALIPKA
jgi:hypothetical protein